MGLRDWARGARERLSRLVKQAKARIDTAVKGDGGAELDRDLGPVDNTSSDEIQAKAGNMFIHWLREMGVPEEVLEVLAKMDLDAPVEVTWIGTIPKGGTPP